MTIRRLILLFGLINASLYAALLPLWEGFDEAFHYSYVETLWATGHLPVLGRSLVPQDVAKSFGLAPVSHIVHRWIAESASYETWLTLPVGEKLRRRRELEALRPEPANSKRPNYEAHHPPLAYLCLAAIDRLAAGEPITNRVLILRLFAALCSVVLLYFGTAALCRTLQLPDIFANAALFTILSSEMLYATTAHVANDWLAVGISALFLASLAKFCSKPERRSAWLSAVWLAAGLLTKAYFLVFALLALAVTALLLWQRRTQWRLILPIAFFVIACAGPWYARNLALYGNVTGTHEQFDGIGFQQAIATVPRIDWLATTGFLARASLWTGNNSFTSFSRSTLNIVLALILLACIAWSFHRRLIRPAERMLVAAIFLFSLAVAYATCASFADTKGDVAGASPWYTQVLLMPVVALAYLGMSRWERWGRALAVLTVPLWTWVFIATWLIKLFPMYSGSGAAPVRIQDVWIWYGQKAAAHMTDLSLLALAPATLLYSAMLLSVSLSVFLCVVILRGLASRPGHARLPS